jgi:hypothetical protein
MIDHGQKEGVVADQWTGSHRGTAVAFFPVRSLDERNIAATSFRNALELAPDKRCVTSKNNDKSLYAGHEQLCYRSLGDRKASQANQRFRHR